LKTFAAIVVFGVVAIASAGAAAADTAPRKPQTYKPVSEQPKKPTTYKPQVERPQPPKTYPLTAAPSSAGAKPSASRSEEKPAPPITVIR